MCGYSINQNEQGSRLIGKWKHKVLNINAFQEVIMQIKQTEVLTSLYCNVPAPTTPAGFETWADSTLRVASQRSNQLGQRVRPAGEKLAGRLDCHIYMYIYMYIHPCEKVIGIFFRHNFFTIYFLLYVLVFIHDICEVFNINSIDFCWISIIGYTSVTFWKQLLGENPTLQ